VVTPFVLAEQDEMAGIFLADPVIVLEAVGGNVNLAADDGLEAGLLAGVVELDDAVEVAVVGDGAGAHAQVFRPRHQGGNTAHAVEQAEFGMNVEMGEHAALFYPRFGPSPGWTPGRIPDVGKVVRN
jgi:hypothetical protein